MKLKTTKSAKAVSTKKATKKAVATVPEGHAKAESPSNTAVKVTVENFDDGQSYIGRKIPTAKIRGEVLGREIEVPKLSKKGFLITRGDKPGVKVTPVLHDGKDLYCYEVKNAKSGNTETRFGSVKAWNSHNPKALHVEIVDAAGLKALAKKLGKALDVKRASDEKRFKVALLNPFGEQYVAGVYVTPKGHVGILNMEHAERWNRHNKRVQFVEPKDIPANSVLKALETV